MFIGNTYLYLCGEDQNKTQVEEENKSNYLEAMSQTEIGKYFLLICMVKSRNSFAGM